MNNYKGIVEYIGSGYCGWQRQKNGLSIQQLIEDTLKILLKEDVSITGSGRTDAGVHALGQIFNFHTAKNFDKKKLLHSLNAILPEDISVKSLTETTIDFNARFSAKSREYKYVIIFRKNVILRNFSWRINKLPDFEKLKEVEKIFLGEKDFRAFCTSNQEVENTKCRVIKSGWSKKNDQLIYNVEANRFIHGMVRGLVGCSLEYGLDKIKLSDIKSLFKKDTNSRCPKWAPPDGLFLFKVKY